MTRKILQSLGKTKGQMVPFSRMHIPIYSYFPAFLCSELRNRLIRFCGPPTPQNTHQMLVCNWCGREFCVIPPQLILQTFFCVIEYAECHYTFLKINSQIIFFVRVIFSGTMVVGLWWANFGFFAYSWKLRVGFFRHSGKWSFGFFAYSWKCRLLLEYCVSAPPVVAVGNCVSASFVTVGNCVSASLLTVGNVAYFWNIAFRLLWLQSEIAFRLFCLQLEIAFRLLCLQWEMAVRLLCLQLEMSPASGIVRFSCSGYNRKLRFGFFVHSWKCRLILECCTFRLVCLFRAYGEQISVFLLTVGNCVSACLLTVGNGVSASLLTVGNVAYFWNIVFRFVCLLTIGLWWANFVFFCLQLEIACRLLSSQWEMVFRLLCLQLEMSPTFGILRFGSSSGCSGKLRVGFFRYSWKLRFGFFAYSWKCRLLLEYCVSAALVTVGNRVSPFLFTVGNCVSASLLTVGNGGSASLLTVGNVACFWNSAFQLLWLQSEIAFRFFVHSWKCRLILECCTFRLVCLFRAYGEQISVFLLTVGNCVSASLLTVGNGVSASLLTVGNVAYFWNIVFRFVCLLTIGLWWANFGFLAYSWNCVSVSLLTVGMAFRLLCLQLEMSPTFGILRFGSSGYSGKLRFGFLRFSWKLRFGFFAYNWKCRLLLEYCVSAALVTVGNCVSPFLFTVRYCVWVCSFTMGNGVSASLLTVGNVAYLWNIVLRLVWLQSVFASASLLTVGEAAYRWKCTRRGFVAYKFLLEWIAFRLIQVICPAEEQSLKIIGNDN